MLQPSNFLAIYIFKKLERNIKLQSKLIFKKKVYETELTKNSRCLKKKDLAMGL
jgi:hypothetical protein